MFLFSGTFVTTNSVGAGMLAVVGFQTFIYVLTMDAIDDCVAWST